MDIKRVHLHGIMISKLFVAETKQQFVVPVHKKTHYTYILYIVKITHVVYMYTYA